MSEVVCKLKHEADQAVLMALADAQKQQAEVKVWK
jgi:hypothetical protein